MSNGVLWGFLHDQRGAGICIKGVVAFSQPPCFLPDASWESITRTDDDSWLFFRLMEALNLLRFLVIRDKVTENQVSAAPHAARRGLCMKFLHVGLPWLQTGVWTELYKIQDSFLQPLRVGLNMSRAHYEQELRNHTERRRNTGEACPPTGPL